MVTSLPAGAPLFVQIPKAFSHVHSACLLAAGLRRVRPGRETVGEFVVMQSLGSSNAGFALEMPVALANVIRTYAPLAFSPLSRAPLRMLSFAVAILA